MTASPHAVDLLDYMREEVADGYDVALTNADAKALLAMISNLDPDGQARGTHHVRVRADNPAHDERSEN